LHIYGFLVCRGSVETKAGLLFDLITAGTKKKIPMLSWCNPKFVKAMKLLVTFSEVLPKKYLLLKNGNVQISDNSIIDWDQEYLNQLDTHFPAVFDMMFDQIIDRIFKNDVNQVSRQEFIEAIDGNYMEKAGEMTKETIEKFMIFKSRDGALEMKEILKGPCDFLFSP
jgi:hypothetical protein